VVKEIFPDWWHSKIGCPHRSVLLPTVVLPLLSNPTLLTPPHQQNVSPGHSEKRLQQIWTWTQTPTRSHPITLLQYKKEKKLGLTEIFHKEHYGKKDTCIYGQGSDGMDGSLFRVFCRASTNMVLKSVSIAWSRWSTSAQVHFLNYPNSKIEE